MKRVPLLELRAGRVGNSRFGRVNVDGVVGFFPIKADFKACVVAGKRSNLCAIEGENMIDDGVNGLLRKVGIVDTQVGIEPAGLRIRIVLR